MPRPPRQHGTLAMRRRGECQTDPCDACLEAGRRYARRNRKQHRMGKVPLVDAGPARRHVEALLAQGMTHLQIQFESGVDRTAIRVLLGTFPNRKASVRIRPATAQKLLAVELNRGSSIGGLVPAVGTVRRIEALRAIGYTRSDLAHRLGYADGQLQIAKKDTVLSSTAKAVAQLYEELKDRPGPSQFARTYALGQGFLPPIWWDDDIDDPLAKPEGLRTLTPNYRIFDDISWPRAKRVAQLHRHGLSVTEIAEHLHTAPKNVRRDLAKTGRKAG